MEDRRRESSTIDGAAPGPPKRVQRDIVDAFESFGISAPERIDQIPYWYEWENAVVVAVFSGKRMGTAWGVALDKETSELVCRLFNVTETAATCIKPAGGMVRLEKSARWSRRITKAEAAAEGLEEDVVGLARVDFPMDLHFNAARGTLLGVDNSGVYQVWDIETGKLIAEGGWTMEVDGSTFGVTMNAVAHTADWVIGVTAHDGTSSTLRAKRIDPRGMAELDEIEIGLSVTGVMHLEIDNEEETVVWLATDSGPFFLDTRYPVKLWAILPGSRWMAAVLKNEDDYLESALAVNSYVSSFKRCTSEEYIKLIEAEGRPHPDVRLDIDKAWYFNNVFYPKMSADLRPHYLLSTGNNEILTLSTEGALWASQNDNKIVPIGVAGGLAAAAIRGGVVIYCEDKTLVLVQSPWAEKKNESFSKKPIRQRTDDEIELTRFNETGCDTKYLIAAVSPTAIVTHAFDNGIYVFRASERFEDDDLYDEARELSTIEGQPGVDEEMGYYAK
jgi:hypothetical protein